MDFETAKFLRPETKVASQAGNLTWREREYHLHGAENMATSELALEAAGTLQEAVLLCSASRELRIISQQLRASSLEMNRLADALAARVTQMSLRIVELHDYAFCPLS